MDACPSACLSLLQVVLAPGCGSSAPLPEPLLGGDGGRPGGHGLGSREDGGQTAVPERGVSGPGQHCFAPGPTLLPPPPLAPAWQPPAPPAPAAQSSRPRSRDRGRAQKLAPQSTKPGCVAGLQHRRCPPTPPPTPHWWVLWPAARRRSPTAASRVRLPSKPGLLTRSWARGGRRSAGSRRPGGWGS